MKLLEKLRIKKMKKFASKTEIKFNKNIMQDIQNSMEWKENNKEELQPLSNVLQDAENANKKRYEGLKIELQEVENVISQSQEANEKEMQYFMHNMMYRDGEVDAEYEETYDDYADKNLLEEKAVEEQNKKPYSSVEMNIIVLDNDIITVSGERKETKENAEQSPFKKLSDTLEDIVECERESVEILKDIVDSHSNKKKLERVERLMSITNNKTNSTEENEDKEENNNEL